ncbi:FecR family protein [Pedobacter gandavensis]|uniref:FecR family protein n=1 Tax=Pedobacter gandavensis TaxID=2679963 RepID=UPI00292D00F8|nr:FecR family protein [Pedobacter gandavensis]
MNDQRFTELLSKKLADEISVEEHKEFMSLLEGNASYRQEYESLKGYFEEETLGTQEEMGGLFERIKGKIEVPESVVLESIHEGPGFRTWFKIAAVLMIGICSFAIYQFFIKSKPVPALIAQNWKTLNTPSRLTQKLVLADGTTVTLNSETQLKYPAEFKGDSREVYLSGEAFFEVKKDASHPFVIHTDKMSIKVLGTSFDVKAYQNDRDYTTSLITGAIQIQLKGNKQLILLKPKEKFSLQNKFSSGADTMAYHVSTLNLLAEGENPATAFMETSWLNHKLIFNEEPFEVLANNLSRWYGIKIIFKNEKLRNVKFTGLFEKENLNEALKALQLIESFQYKIADKTIYIY